MEIFLRTIGYTNLVELYQLDKHLVYKFSPNKKIKYKFKNFDFFISTNSEGYRGEEILIENKKEHKIFCLGDSTTFGWGVEFEYVWTKKLEKFLNGMPSENKFKVINYGVPGYTSFQGVRLLKEVLVYTPDVIIFSFGKNDSDRVRQTESEKCKDITKVKLFLQNTPLKSKTYGFFMFNFYIIGRQIKNFLLSQPYLAPKIFRHDDAKKIFHRVPIDEYVRNLKEAIKICNSNNIKLIFLNMGWNTNECPSNENHDILYLDTTSELGKYYGIPVVEFERSNINPGLFTHDNVHPNILGHEVIAKKVLNAIITNKY